ncbi:MFS transporter [Paenibacillus macerans]|uniref:MFS transporter n=1 Tax=Paenibacillus macerans TaxID=44252 RepID=UPI003D3145F9
MKNNPSPSGLRANRSFRHIFAAYALATFGDWFDALAIQVLVAYRWGADPLLLALIPVSMALPAVLLGSFAGTLADRLQKAKLMFLCDLLTAGLTAAILVAPGLLWLLPLLALRAAAGVFHVPAQQALTRQVVLPGQLLQATSLNGLVGQGSKVAGPLLGAVTLAALSPQACIVINIAARLLSAALLFPLRRLQGLPVPAAETDRGKVGEGQRRPKLAEFLADWREGWLFIAHTKQVRNTMVFGFIGMIVLMMIDYQFPTLLRVIAPENESLIGWLVSAIGAGAVIVLLLLKRLNRVSSGFGLGGGCAVIGTGIALLGWCPPGTGVGLLLGLGLLIGIGNGAYLLTQNYVLQKETPEHAVGRVFGIQNTMSSLIMLTAPLAGGFLIRSVSAGKAFLLIGLALALIGIIGVLFRQALWPEKLGVSPDPHSGIKQPEKEVAH